LKIWHLSVFGQLLFGLIRFNPQQQPARLGDCHRNYDCISLYI